MGREAMCTVITDGKVAAGKALLEQTEILFRGTGVRLKIPFERIRSVRARGGTLAIVHSEGAVAFELGEKEAAAWAGRIKNPPGRLDKLGVKPDAKVVLIGTLEAEFVEELRRRTDKVTAGEPVADSDVIFFAVQSPGDLRRLPALKRSLQPAGAIWVVRAKGPEATVKEAEVMAAGKAAGLVDTKVVSFSATHTAERLVIPVARR
jgi:hypothetical protein